METAISLLVIILIVLLVLALSGGWGCGRYGIVACTLAHLAQQE